MESKQLNVNTTLFQIYNMLYSIILKVKVNFEILTNNKPSTH